METAGPEFLKSLSAGFPSLPPPCPLYESLLLMVLINVVCLALRSPEQRSRNKQQEHANILGKRKKENKKSRPNLL